MSNAIAWEWSKISTSLGLEGLITFKRENRYEPETYQVLVPVNPSEPDGECVKIGVFDKVTVEISIEKVCRCCNASRVRLKNHTGQEHPERTGQNG